MAQNLEAAVQPDESQMTLLGQPAGETIEDASAWPEWLTGGTTRSCWNFDPATTVGRQSTDTELTPQEACSRNCSTTHTSWSTGRTRATGSRREAQIFIP
jgi:hypothetical protein